MSQQPHKRDVLGKFSYPFPDPTLLPKKKKKIKVLYFKLKVNQVIIFVIILYKLSLLNTHYCTELNSLDKIYYLICLVIS